MPNIADDYAAIAKGIVRADLPDYYLQCGESLTETEAREWIKDAAKECRDRGCTWIRASYDDKFSPTLYLVEGWKVRPEPIPKPSFHLTAAPT